MANAGPTLRMGMRPLVVVNEICGPLKKRIGLQVPRGNCGCRFSAVQCKQPSAASIESREFPKTLGKVPELQPGQHLFSEGASKTFLEFVAWDAIAYLFAQVEEVPHHAVQLF